VISSWSSRPAKIAASFEMFSSSAPVRPAVWRAIELRSTSSGERLAPRVDAENLFAAGEVGRSDQHLPVEAPRPQQRCVEILETVGGAHDDHLVARLEAVELDEQLVEGLVLLAGEAVPRALRTDGVELVDEDDRGAFLRASSNSLRIRAAPRPANISTNAEALWA
jgi:hypothetical protein